MSLLAISSGRTTFWTTRTFVSAVRQSPDLTAAVASREKLADLHARPFDRRREWRHHRLGGRQRLLDGRVLGLRLHQQPLGQQVDIARIGGISLAECGLGQLGRCRVAEAWWPHATTQTRTWRCPVPVPSRAGAARSPSAVPRHWRPPDSPHRDAFRPWRRSNAQRPTAGRNRAAVERRRGPARAAPPDRSVRSAAAATGRWPSPATANAPGEPSAPGSQTRRPPCPIRKRSCRRPGSWPARSPDGRSKRPSSSRTCLHFVGRQRGGRRHGRSGPPIGRSRLAAAAVPVHQVSRDPRRPRPSATNNPTRYLLVDLLEADVVHRTQPMLTKISVRGNANRRTIGHRQSTFDGSPGTQRHRALCGEPRQYSGNRLFALPEEMQPLAPIQADRPAGQIPPARDTASCSTGGWK